MALSGLGHATTPHALARYITSQSMWALALGIPFCGPLWGWIKTTCYRLGQATPVKYRSGVQIFGGVLEVAIVLWLLLVSAIWLAGGTL
ncbi:MAG: hypothetical protein WDN00_12050 [Limisphaerales bacterium]